MSPVIIKKPIYLMNNIELVACLTWNVRMSFQVMKKLFKEEIDGKEFLKMKKKDLSKFGLMDNYFQLCLLFPYAKFVDELI